MRLRLAGVAAFLAPALGCFLTIVFMIYTHGSSGADRNGTFLGLDGHFFCRVVAIEAILLLVVLGAVRREVLPRRGLAFSSVGVAIIGSVMYLAGRVLQCWLADPGRDFEGIRVTVGFYLDGVGRMVLATSLLVGGISAIRRHLGSSIGPAIMLTGVGLWLALIGAVLLDRASNDLAAAATGLLFWIGLCWVGQVLLTEGPRSQSQ